MGESIKVGLEYQKNFWRENGIGTIMSQFGPAQELHDHQHDTDQSSFVLKGFISPEFHRAGLSDRKRKVMDQMKMYFDHSLPEPQYFEKDWQDDEFTFSPYETNVVPHQHNGNSMFRETYFDKKLYHAGSETAQASPGYLDGAVERGFSVAKEIIADSLSDEIS